MLTLRWRTATAALLALCVPSLASRRQICVREMLRPTPAEAKFSADDPSTFIRYLDISASMRNVVSSFDPVLKTRLYHALSEPDAAGNVPLIPPDAKAVVIYFHGSGTKKAGGKNFLQKAHQLINSGVAVVSIDLPFHSEGPFDPQLYDQNYFMQWIDKLVDTIAASGKPIFGVGHSFGPYVLLEYMARHPKKLAGALLISASGSYHPALRYTYERITAPGMRFIDENLQDYEGNEVGGIWGATVEDQATWMFRPAPDSNMVFLRGTDDEWFPENRWLPTRLGVTQPYKPREVEEYLAKKFPKAKFVFAEGVGHYIFETADERGKNLILQTLYDMIGIPEADRFRVPTPPPARQQLALHYYSDPTFRAWVGDRYVRGLAIEERARRYLLGWHDEKRKMWNEIFTRIPQRDPEFFSQRWVSWEILDQMRKKEDEARPAMQHDTEGPQERPQWVSEVKAFRAEYGRYLEARARFQHPNLGRDPLRPADPTFDASLFQLGKVYRSGIAGPILEADCRQTIEAAQATLVSVEPKGPQLIRFTYRMPEREEVFQAWAFNDGISRDTAQSIVMEAYFDALRKNNWKPLNKAWEGTARGIRVKGTQMDRKILTVDLAQP